MSVLVYQAINAITAELSETGIAKNHRNEEAEYSYRSIEDVLGALAPLLARHRLCVLPRILSREAIRSGRASQLVSVQAAFDLVSALDGSTHTVQSYGEALDDSDKGTAKAISAAYKLAMLQAFCIPVPKEDADALSTGLNGSRMNGAAHPEPPEGWDSWASEVIAIAKSCESAEAVDRLLTMRRALLASLQRSRPELYATIGEAIAGRLETLQHPLAKPDVAAVQELRVSNQRASAHAHRAKTAAKPENSRPIRDTADAERAAAQTA